MRAWRLSLATRIVLAFLAAFMFSIAGLLFSLPLTYDNGDHSADWIVILIGLVIVGFGIFATFALIVAVRTEITLDSSTLEATVVGGHNLLLVPQFRKIRLPLSQIRSVERRCEIFRRLGLSTMRDALSVVTADGERIGLFSNTLGNLSTLPIDNVANAIAAAAGVTVTDDGTVWARGSGLYGAASSYWIERPLDAASAHRARHAAIRTVQICTALLLLTFVLRACL
jgi:hypothetical protein